MILDYEFSRDKRQFSISFINKDGNKEIKHFDNIQRFLTYYYTPNGRYASWDEAKCDTKWTNQPSRFDLKEFIYNLSPEIQAQLDQRTFPKLYTFDIETKLKPGPNGELGQGDFTEPTIADEPIHTISLVSPNMNGVVMGDKKLSEEDIKWVEHQFLTYMESIPFFKTLNIPTPKFKYIYFDKEENMLRFFMENVVSKVPVLAGWNSIGYDWCYITSRIKNFFPNLSIKKGSATGTVRPKKFTNKKGEDITLLHPVHTLVLDMMDVIEQEDTQVLPMKESMNLDYVSHEALGANKVEYEGNLEELYTHDYRRYVFYNLIDSILVQLNDKKFKTMDHIYMYSLYARERIGQCFSKIALTEALIFKYFHSKNIKIPWVPKEQGERGRLLGAYVKEPLPGLYKYVVCNDFASLYPSTMRTCNISFENYVGCFWKETILDRYRKDISFIVIGPNVFKNKGTAAKPEIGEMVGQYVDWDAVEKYKKDPKYFVSVNGCVYRNDKDYTLKSIMTELYSNRNASKYLSKDLDAMVISDIDHILHDRKEKLYVYKDNAVALIREMGYEFKCGEDIRKWYKEHGADALKEFERELKTMIVYHANLEQAIKLMMNSVYGGTSHIAFYWFNINLANDITGESRNLTKMMEKHLTEYWKTAWQTEPELAKIREKLGIQMKSLKEVEQIIKESKCNSLIINTYGDTDSLYISYEPLIKTIEGWEKMSHQEILEVVLAINLEFLDNHNFEYIKEYYDKRHGVSVHKFELETCALRALWTNVKKRYGQILLYKDGKRYDLDDLPVKVKGLEVAKSSYPTKSREYLKKLLRFILEYDGKYLSQEMNLKSMEYLDEWMNAPIDLICENKNINGYMSRIVSDDDPNTQGPVTAKGAAYGVKALAMYNWIVNTKHLQDANIYGGKMKIYTIKGSSIKNGDIYFAYEGTKYPKWADQYAPIDRRRMYQKFVLDPVNRLLSSANMPILNLDGSIQMSLFD